jgi:hypothetical protein
MRKVLGRQQEDEIQSDVRILISWRASDTHSEYSAHCSRCPGPHPRAGKSSSGERFRPPRRGRNMMSISECGFSSPCRSHRWREERAWGTCRQTGICLAERAVDKARTQPYHLAAARAGKVCFPDTSAFFVEQCFEGVGPFRG